MAREAIPPSARPGAREDAATPFADLVGRAPGALLAATLEAAAGGIVICDAAGTLVFANAAARRWTQPGETGPGTSLTDGAAAWGEWCVDGAVVPVEDWPITRALRGEVVVGREMSTRTADGRRHHLLVSASPVRDASGAVVAAVCTTADIDRSERAEAEVRALNALWEERVAQRTAELERVAAARRATAEELARSQQMLADIVNHTDNPVFLKDRAGRYLLVNRAFEALFGIAPGWMVGRTDFDLFSDEVAHAFRANDARALDSDEPLHMEEQVPAPDGARTYLTVKFPLRDRDGAVYGVGGIATDITERTRVAAELARSQALLAAVVESSADAIWAVDRHQRLVAWNTHAAEYVEREFRAPIGRLETAGAVPPDLARRWQDYLQRALGGERFVVEESLPGGDGPRRHLVSLNPTIQQGEVTGVAVFSRDVTDLRRAEESARQHQAELAHALRLHTIGEMAAGLAHEVNQPLGAIANYANGCRRRIEAGDLTVEELLPTIQAIAREALRAGEITRRMRTVLRKEDGRRETVDVAALIEAAVGLALPTAARAGVSVISPPAPALPPVVADPIQIEQVLLNLLLNAVEASGRGARPGRVEVWAREAPAGGIEVSVADDGPGVDAGLGDRIFEPFLTTKPGGLGMGLAISRSIVDAHGGRLWMTDNPAGGAMFRFTLPAGAAPVRACT